MLKLPTLLIVSMVVLFYVAVNFSSVITKYECKGVFTLEGERSPKTIFIKIETFRSWVALWNNSDAYLYVEAPNEWINVYYRVKKTGEQMQIFDSKNALVGNFSNLSKTLALKTPTGFFDGTCTAIKNDQ